MLRTAALLLFSAACVPCSSQTAPHQPSFYGTFSSLRYLQEQGDTVGYEVTVVPQRGGDYVIYQCAEGEPTDPVFTKAEISGRTITFAVNVPDSPCSGRMRGTLTPKGLLLHFESDATELLPRKRSYWSK